MQAHVFLCMELPSASSSQERGGFQGPLPQVTVPAKQSPNLPEEWAETGCRRPGVGADLRACVRGHCGCLLGCDSDWMPTARWTRAQSATRSVSTLVLPGRSTGNGQREGGREGTRGIQQGSVGSLQRGEPGAPFPNAWGAQGMGSGVRVLGRCYSSDASRGEGWRALVRIL